MQARRALIMGAAGHAISVAEPVRSAGCSLAEVVSAESTAPIILDQPVLPEISGSPREGGIVVDISLSVPGNDDLPDCVVSSGTPARVAYIRLSGDLSRGQ
jgi:hypothetical protein